MEINVDNFFIVTKIEIVFTKLLPISNQHYKYFKIIVNRDLNSIYNIGCFYIWISTDTNIFPRCIAVTDNIIYLNFDVFNYAKNIKVGDTVFITGGLFNIFDNKEQFWKFLANTDNLTLDQINIITKLI